MSRFIADLRELSHQFEHICEAIAKKYKIEHLAGPQGHVLIFLDRHLDKEIFVKDIENELQISKSVTSNLVKRMEKNGFITIKHSLVDKRYKQVVMTKEGAEKIPLLQECRKDIENYFFKDITKEELLTIKKVVNQLNYNMLHFKGDKDA
ncbi:MarR family transcriptional regulator [Streptococcus didelphis]|uniref:MarR family winged helix-turn-helix transcriptional regulator n=1 Tax=Streptococcus didelphis TaxID=102886 RepID=UPI00036B7955|nr:MarR family transcriptional regulator [Streptococcus didelphis]WMB29799.1 MarR family transcriptional regulator [Streptococcus didelphis]